MSGREDRLRAVLAAVDHPDPDPVVDCPPGEFTTRSAGLGGTAYQEVARPLIEYKIADKVGFRGPVEGSDKDRRMVYRLTDNGREELEDHLETVAERSGPLPCSESDTCRGDSFENPRGIDGVRCKDCGTVYSREEVRV